MGHYLNIGNDNRTRALAQAVSVDGWIGEFAEDGTANVHVDVVFRQGSFGDDNASKIRFRIALRRAEIVIRIPSDGGVSVVKRSIQRSKQKITGAKITQKNKSRGLSLKARFGLGKDGADGSAEAEGLVEQGFSEQVKIDQGIANFLCQHFTTGDDLAAWEIRANQDIDSLLSGAPWEPESEPRLKVKHTGDDPGAASVVVEVRCERRDIEILDLEEKDSDGWRSFRGRSNRMVNLAAAEQVIKRELYSAGFFQVADLSEKYARLLIADKILIQDVL